MVVAEVLTGIALVQQSVKFIKENISTVQDIGQIANQIDDLFAGEKQVQQARAKELAAAARRKKIQADREFEEGVKQFALIGVIIAVAFALIIFLMISVARALIV